MSMRLIRHSPRLVQIAGETNGWLLLGEGGALLIDCPLGPVASLLATAGLPAPALVLQTHVQEEHCDSPQHWPAVPVWVAAGDEELATRSDRFYQECRTVWPPSRAWDNRGEEPWGVGGCVTARVPRQALPLGGLLRPGDTLTHFGLTLQVLGLPGHGKRALGFYWASEGLLFSGDLLLAGGYLVNFYDLERAYGLNLGYQDLERSLAVVKDLAPRALAPATGPLSADPLGDLARLSQRLDALRRVPRRRVGQPGGICNLAAPRQFGRYREAAPGVYQNTNFGNIILLVDGQGRGLMVDPDFCVWESWEENCRQFLADLDLLRAETGLRTLDTCLITHYHGDHVQYANLLRDHLGTRIITTPDVRAVMERPWEFRYPCAVDWYGFPFDHVKADETIPYDQPFDWHGTAITPIWSPGHCGAHASFVLDWRGQRLLLAGDVFQYGSGTIGAGLPIMYNDNAWPERGAARTYRRFLAQRPTLILGGHSHACADPDHSILRDFAEVAEAMEAVASELVLPGTMERAMTPPGYDAVRPLRGG